MKIGPPYPLYTKLEFSVSGAGTGEFLYRAEDITRFDRLYFDLPYRDCRVRYQLHIDEKLGVFFSDWLPVSFFAGIGTDGKLGQPIHTKTLERAKSFALEFWNQGVHQVQAIGVLSGQYTE